MPTPIWTSPNSAVKMRVTRSSFASVARSPTRGFQKSLAAAVAQELRELERVDIAAAKIAPRRIPRIPTGISARMKWAKTRSARSNATSGGKSW